MLNLLKKTMKKYLLFSLLYFCSFVLLAQEEQKTANTPQNSGQYLDFALSGSPQKNTDSYIFALSAAWNRWHYVALKKRFFVGYGLRLTSSFAKNNSYITAPASISEGNFLKAQNQAKLDTLQLSSGQINSLNAVIHLGYRFSSKLVLGFNIDALGFSFGGEQKGNFYAYTQGKQPSAETAKVNKLNVLLTGDYDIGSLNSELYAMYQLNDKIALRGGFSFLFSEYISNQKLTFDNDRFRAKTLSPFLAISIGL